jgi:hypothetical protein
MKRVNLVIAFLQRGETSSHGDEKENAVVFSSSVDFGFFGDERRSIRMLLGSDSANPIDWTACAS